MDAALRFLRKLKKNNTRPWFDAHRDEYAEAKQEVEAFVNGLIAAYRKKDPAIGGLTAKDCMFRINRDIRFSKDKSPYKLNFGVSINSGGKKSTLAGYYLHIEPGESFVGGGIWMPMPPDLSKIRQEIDYHPDEFTTLIKAPAFKKQYSLLYRDKEVSLQRVPKGYEADHPLAEYIKLKSFLAMRKLTDEEVNSASLQKICIAAFTALKPLNEFINKAVS